MRFASVLMLVSVAACSGSSKASDASARDRPAIALQGRVTDAANVIPAPVEARLSRKLAAYERRTGHQLVVVTVTSLGGRDVSMFTRDLANSWGIGRKAYNDGIVILMAPNERKVRIEVGRGLESTLTNERAYRVIQHTMIPHFKAGQVGEGLEQGATAVIATIDDVERSRERSSRK